MLTLEDAQISLGLLLALLLSFYNQLQWQGNSESTALAQAAFQLNLALHQIHNALHNGHAEARALNATGSAILHPREGLKNVLLELLAHAYAIILHHKLKELLLILLTGQLTEENINFTAIFRVFNGVGN